MEHRGRKYHRGRLSEAIREEIETILEGELAERSRLRKPPELYFQIDRADQLESRVDELLSREKKRRRKGVEPSP